MNISSHEFDPSDGFSDLKRLVKIDMFNDGQALALNVYTIIPAVGVYPSVNVNQDPETLRPQYMQPTTNWVSPKTIYVVQADSECIPDSGTEEDK